MGERIKELRKALGLTQQQFADKIKVKRNTVAQYEIGRNEPIETVISLICREFNVNENWLRTGEGEMFVTLTKEEELTDFLADLIKGERGDFARRLVSVLSRMTPDEWDMLERKAKELMAEMEQGE